MSNFASLLGQLEKSAKVAATKRRTDPEEKDCRQHKKRDRSDDIKDTVNNKSSSRAINTKRSRIILPYPPDYDQLSIKVSFLVIGAQKAATSWLHEMLCKCDGLGLPQQKEIHFWDWHRKKSLGWYSKQFPKKGLKTFYGEITPCYMTLPESDVAEIHKLFPNVRIIFIARDLVDRAWSALLMELRNSLRGMDAGQFEVSANSNNQQQLKKKMEEEEANPDLYDDDYFIERLKHTTHSIRSDYATGIKRWLQYFSKDQLLIINYDDIKDRPQEVLQKTLNHIGLQENGNTNGNSSSLFTDEKAIERKVNVASGLTHNKKIRPSLRKKMEFHLTNNAKDFNHLLKTLGYGWELNAYTT